MPLVAISMEQCAGMVLLGQQGNIAVPLGCRF